MLKENVPEIKSTNLPQNQVKVMEVKEVPLVESKKEDLSKEETLEKK